MFDDYRNRGGIVDINFGFAYGILSYNKTEFSKDTIYYQVNTWIFLFVKYEEINYRYKNL